MGEANRRARASLDGRQSFVVESTLAGRDPERPSTYIVMMREARGLGYRVDFVFIALENPEMHLLRVATRVEEGGHDIPADLVVARYAVSTGVRLGQGYDAADGFRLLTSSGAGTFEVLVVAERGEASYLADALPAWAERGLGERLGLLRARDRLRVAESARERVGDPDRFAYLVERGLVHGEVVAVGAGHIAFALAARDDRFGLAEGSIAIVPAAAPAERLVGLSFRYDIDRRAPVLDRREDPFDRPL